MRGAELEALRRLAEARKASDLAALERLIAERRACAAEIEAVVATRAAELAQPLGAVSPEVVAARLRWVEQRVAELRTRERELAPRIAAARAAAAVSLGKDEALGQLRDRAMREAAQLRASRAAGDAPPSEERPAEFE